MCHLVFDLELHLCTMEQTVSLETSLSNFQGYYQRWKSILKQDSTVRCIHFRNPIKTPKKCSCKIMVRGIKLCTFVESVGNDAPITNPSTTPKNVVTMSLMLSLGFFVYVLHQPPSEG